MSETIYRNVAYRPSLIEHRYGPHVRILSDPVLLTYLARLCAKETVQPGINRLTSTLYYELVRTVLAAEFPRTLVDRPTRMVAHTPHGVYHGNIIDPATQAVVVDIARAGTLPSFITYDTLNHLLDPAGVRQDHLMMSRTVDAQQQVTGAEAGGFKIGGPIAGRYVLFPDPMGATGSSLSRAVRIYKEEFGGGAAKYIAIHLIITPEYIRRMTREHPDVLIYAVRLDRGLSPESVFATIPGTHPDEERGLNDQHYIVPGGGGFGEILNNAYV